MRLLFVLKGLALVRHFDETLTLLADAGHQIVLAPTKFGDEELLPSSLATHANCSVVAGSPKRHEARNTTSILRHARDYLRYQDPALIGATANRRRALSNLARVVSHGTRDLANDGHEPTVPLNRHEVRRLRETFDELEQLLPSDPSFEQFIAAQQPDVMLITPLVSFGGLQSDFVKAARRLGIPSACLVFSWDNLTNKGVMHERPDRTFVWNETQRQEAITLHRVPADTVVATGAPRFDPFFRRTVSMTREAFCQSLGLDPSAKLIGYLGSSPIVSVREPEFTTRWIEALRQSDNPQLRNAQVVLRPHPRAKTVWTEHPRFADRGPSSHHGQGLAVTRPKSATGDQGLFDTLFHVDAVVGLNTTAELEAGILGKPVYTITVPEFATGQAGSHHFHYLLRNNGGFVECANGLEQHLDQLADGLAGRFDRQGIHDFIEQFLRPRGFDTPVGPVFADEIEQWAREAVAHPVEGTAASASRPKEPSASRPVLSDAAATTPDKVQIVYNKAPLFIFARHTPSGNCSSRRASRRPGRSSGSTRMCRRGTWSTISARMLGCSRSSRPPTSKVTVPSWRLSLATRILLDSARTFGSTASRGSSFHCRCRSPTGQACSAFGTRR